MARDVSLKLGSGRIRPVSQQDTVFAAKFYILSCLHRLGWKPRLEVSRKAAAISVTLPDERIAFIDVYGLAGSTGFPVNRIRPASSRHFIAFVSFRDLIADLGEAPEVYIVPTADLEDLVYRAPGGRKLVRLSSLRSLWHVYEDAWDSLIIHQ